jgi:hypothetical protein
MFNIENVVYPEFIWTWLLFCEFHSASVFTNYTTDNVEEVGIEFHLKFLMKEQAGKKKYLTKNVILKYGSPNKDFD